MAKDKNSRILIVIDNWPYSCEYLHLICRYNRIQKFLQSCSSRLLCATMEKIGEIEYDSRPLTLIEFRFRYQFHMLQRKSLLSVITQSFIAAKPHPLLHISCIELPSLDFPILPTRRNGIRRFTSIVHQSGFFDSRTVF